jgi:ribose transport system substrate-binding protein
MDAIRDGSCSGAITQNPVGIGYETVKAAVEAIDGKELPKTIDTGFYWYDASNIDDERSRPSSTGSDRARRGVGDTPPPSFR